MFSRKRTSAREQRTLKRLRRAAFEDEDEEVRATPGEELDLTAAGSQDGHSAPLDSDTDNASYGGDGNDWQLEPIDDASTGPTGSTRILPLSMPASEVGELAVGGPSHRRTPTSAEDIGNIFAEMQARREVPIAVMSEIVNLMIDNKEVFCRSLANGDLKTFRQMRYHAIQSLPPIKVDVGATTADGERILLEGNSSYPKRVMANRCLRRDYVLYHVSLSDVVKFHAEQHEEAEAQEFDMSLDGIPESKSSGLSTDILSVRFTNCRQVYTIAVLQPARKAMQLPESIILRHFLLDYSDAAVKLRYIIADAPKRAALRGLKQHSATHGCPYCTAAKVDKKYPSCVAGELRTDSEVRRLAQLIAEGGEVDEDVLQGVKQVSPLAELNIDIINDIPAEKMHLCELGVVRKILQLSYKCPAFKATDVPFIRMHDKDLSERLLRIKCLPQFSRRTRALDLANYKAEEFRYLVLCFWPAVYDTLPPQVSELWLLTVFIMRVAYLPDKWYTRFEDEYDMQNLLDRWYAMFEQVFGVRHCSYNIHVFGRHLLQVRALGPLSMTSAVCYESHYNIIKRSTRPGTPSTGQQAIANSLLATKYKHVCKMSRSLTAHVTARTDDSLCYMNSGRLVRATTAANEDGEFEGIEIATQAAFHASAGLDFNIALAFRISPTQPQRDELTYQTCDVVGKCVAVGDVVSVVPWDVLHDT